MTPGDPGGIGPEIVARWVAARGDDPGQVRILGDVEAVQRACRSLGLPQIEVEEPEPGEELVEVRALRQAMREIEAGRASGLVTGPIHKERLARSGFAFTGHTDFLAHLCGRRDPVMAFVGGRVAVALVTVHIPLAEVPAALSEAKILHTMRVADAAWRRALGLERPRLWVAGLNPHAGDGGVLGEEDLRIIAPAVQAAQAEGIDAVGPISAEAAFQRAVQGEGDLVVAMYHDQGLVPLKALGAAGLGRSVNWTLGLPILRTSVDHGTAYDIVGKGVADPSSLDAAVRWAERLVRLRGARG